jgi:hypothetical protein
MKYKVRFDDNPINESGYHYEDQCDLALKQAKVHAIYGQRLPVQGNLLPGQDYQIPDWYVPQGILDHSYPIVISIKGLTGEGSEQKKLLSHLDREIPSYGCPTVLVLCGDWSQAYIKEAYDHINGIDLIAVLLGPDKLYSWAKQRVNGVWKPFKPPSGELTLGTQPSLFSIEDDE